ncbi:hypothetical protein GN956_G5167 [Arapaima gigas]
MSHISPATLTLRDTIKGSAVAPRPGLRCAAVRCGSADCGAVTVAALLPPYSARAPRPSQDLSDQDGPVEEARDPEPVVARRSSNGQRWKWSCLEPNKRTTEGRLQSQKMIALERSGITNATAVGSDTLLLCNTDDLGQAGPTLTADCRITCCFPLSST